MIAQSKVLAAGAAVLLLTGAVVLLQAEPPAKPETKKKMTTSATSATDTAAKKYTVPSDEELKKKLTAEQWKVVRENGTERAGTNEYWRTEAEGIYVSVVTGEPLFSSKDKFISECGWPAFAKPINDTEIKELVDKSVLGWAPRTEVRAKLGDSHLGHVFDDGPAALGGKRYCINSAALRFVPKERMAEAGYGELLKQFETPKK